MVLNICFIAIFLLVYQKVLKLNTTKFWKDMQNISTVLEKLEFSNATITTNILNNQNFLSSVKVLAIPSSNFTIDSCFTIPLPRNTNLQRISISYLSEVNVYFHYPGHFLNVWIDKKNVFTTSSKTVVKPSIDQVFWHSLNINMIFEKYYGIDQQKTITYDECVLNIDNDNGSKIEDYVRPVANGTGLFGKLQIDEIIMGNLFDNLTYADKYCSDPVDFAKFHVLSAAMREKINIPIIGGYKYNDFDAIYTEKLDFMSKKTRPRAIINIPRFSKVIQVSLDI